MQTIEVDSFLSADEAVADYPELFHTFKTLLDLSDDYAAQAVSIVAGVCNQCWAAPMGCQCWNDE